MKKLIFLIAFGLICSCDRLGQKVEQTKEVVEEKTKEEVSKLTEKAVNKIFPPFDSDKPDTDNNKKRFTDFLKVDLTEDIKNIFCFDDAIGIDADYMFSFNCDSTTSKKIINVNKLTIDKVNKDCGFGMQHDFEWWDKNKINHYKNIVGRIMTGTSNIFGMTKGTKKRTISNLTCSNKTVCHHHTANTGLAPFFAG